MEHQKVLNLFNEPNDSKFVIRKWNSINNQPNANYDVGNEIIYNAEVLKSKNLCKLQWCLHFSKRWYHY